MGSDGSGQSQKPFTRNGMLLWNTLRWLPQNARLRIMLGTDRCYSGFWAYGLRIRPKRHDQVDARHVSAANSYARDCRGCPTVLPWLERPAGLMPAHNRGPMRPLLAGAACPPALADSGRGAG